MKIVFKTNKGSYKVSGFALAGVLSLLLLSVAVFGGANYQAGQVPTNVTIQVWVSLVPSTALQQGIFFGTVNTSSTNNPALNNTGLPNGGTQYNITIGSESTSDVDLYHKLNETFPTGVYVNHKASITNETHGFNTEDTLEVTTSWTLIGNATVNCSSLSPGNNCWLRYFMNVSSGVAPGTYERKYQYCGVFAGGSASTYCSI